jgi:hypothetical protein
LSYIVSLLVSTSIVSSRCALMFKSFLDGLASGSHSQGSGSGGGQQANGSKGVTPAQLRSDIYSAIDLMGVWISSGKAENGIDYRSILVSSVLLIGNRYRDLQRNGAELSSNGYVGEELFSCACICMPLPRFATSSHIARRCGLEYRPGPCWECRILAGMSVLRA